MVIGTTLYYPPPPNDSRITLMIDSGQLGRILEEHHFIRALAVESRRERGRLGSTGESTSGGRDSGGSEVTGNLSSFLLDRFLGMSRRALCHLHIVCTSLR